MDKEALEKVGSKEMKMKGLILRTISHELKQELMDLTTTEVSTTNLPTIANTLLNASKCKDLSIDTVKAKYLIKRPTK